MRQGTDTRNKILQSALKSFSRHGYEGARMEQIAADTGINKASLYFHFTGKEEIFLVLFQQIVNKYQQKLEQIFASSQQLPLKERLIQIYRNYLSYHWNNPEMDFWNMVYYYPPAQLKQKIIQITTDSYTDLVDRLTVILQEGIDSRQLQNIKAQDMALSYYYLLTCIGLSIDLMNKEQLIQNMDACFNIYWNGIRIDQRG